MTPQITIIFSRHRSVGICNSDALYQIIERINPEVIFEELCENNFERAYSEHSLITLETMAIGLYQLSYPVKHIPVDTYKRPENFDEKIEALYNELFLKAGESSFHFRNFSDQMVAKVGQYGFPLLNSDANELLNDKRDELIAKALKTLNDKKLIELRRLELDVIERREEFILENIFRYSHEHHFGRGLMLIGSGHRKSIMQKVSQRSITEKLKIRWQYFLDL